MVPGPRNSRTSYVGGEIWVCYQTRLLREILNNEDFPIYFNIFNDYGSVWQNKTKPTHSDNKEHQLVWIKILFSYGLRLVLLGASNNG